MEIVSDLNESCRAPPIHQADKPVHDEATKYPMIEARLLAIRDLTQSNPAQALCFIKAFEVQERVKPALEKLHSWTPSRKIRAVIEAACRDLYPVDDIEGAFYTYGGMHGIVALAAIVDAKVPIFILWDGIKSQLVRKWVVWRISGHARNTSNSWVTQQQKAWPNSLGSSWKYINWTNKATGEAEHPYLGIIERRKISRAACDGQHPYPARELHKQDDVAQQTKPNGDQQAIDDAGQTLLTPPPEHDRQPKRPKLDHCNTLQDSPLRSSSIQYTADEQYLYHNPQENKTSLKSVSFTNPLPTIDFITNRSNMPKPPIFTENQSPNCLISKTQGRPPPLQQPQHQIWRPELLTDLFCATTDLSPQRGWQSCTSPNQDGTRFPLALNMTLQEMSTSPVSCYGQSIHESLPSTTLPVIPSESHGSHSSPVLSNAIAAFEGLNPHVKNLAMLLAFLGDADIPKRMLYQAAKPSCTFNRTGEFDPVPAPDLGPLFGQSPMLDVVLQQLQSQGHIQYDPLAESFRVVPGIRVHIHSTTPGHIVQNANYQVSRLIFHTFPTNPDDGPDL